VRNDFSPAHNRSHTPRNLWHARCLSPAPSRLVSPGARRLHVMHDHACRRNPGDPPDNRKEVGYERGIT
jgi:hypothetical protein